MSLEYLVSRIKAGLWTFSKLVFNSNGDLPYHDSHDVTSQTTEDSYTVGKNNIDAHGGQHKLFISKSTLVFSDEATHIHFNNPNNVAQTILANTWYTFIHNVRSVYFPIPNTDKHLYFSFEGVLPEEARTPE